MSTGGSSRGVELSDDKGDDMGKQQGKCPKCGRGYTDKIRAPTTAGEYDLFDGELKSPPCLACAKADDKRSAAREREAAKLASLDAKRATA